MNRKIIFACVLISLLSGCGPTDPKENVAFRIEVDAEICSIALYQFEKSVAVAINDSNINRQIIELINSADFTRLPAINDNDLRGAELNALTITWRNGSTPRVLQISRDGFAVNASGQSFSSKYGGEAALKIYDILISNELINSTKNLDPFK